MAYIKADIVSATLVDLGVRAIGETAAAGETTEVNTRFDAALDLVLKETGVTINPAAIAVYLHRPLVGYLVQVCAPTFGAAPNGELTAAAWELLIAAVRTGNTATSTTKDLLIEETLLTVGRLKPGQHASATDKVYVANQFDAALDLVLKETGVTINPAAISIHLYQPLLAYLARGCAPTYGAARDDDAVAAAFDVLLGAVRQSNAAASSVGDKLIEETLLALGYLSPGQHASNADKAYVSELLDNLLGQLSKRNVIAITNQAAIAAAQFNPLLIILTQLAGPKFGKPYNGDTVKGAEEQLFLIGRADNTASTVADKLIAEVLLALGAVPVGGLPSTKDKTYVSSLLDNALADFTRRDVVVIPNQGAITAEQANALTAYLIELARSKFQVGKPADGQAMAAAEEWLRTLYRRGLTAGTTTKDKLVEQVLVSLGRVPPGGYPSTADKLLVTRQLDFILSDLAGRNIIYIADSDSIEDAQFSPLADYVGEVLAPQISMPRRPRDIDMLRMAERALRTISRIGQGTGENLRVDRALRPASRTFNFMTGQ